MPLDPHIAAMLQQFAGMPAIESLAVADAREMGNAISRASPPGPEVERVEDRAIATAHGRLPVRIYHGGPRTVGVMVYFHAGGWTLGSLDGCDTPVRILAQRTGLCIVSVDYRLAPEHRFPAAVEDAVAALTWAGEEIEELAGARVPLLIAGESAGGNLAAVAAVLARDAGGPALAGQILLYPVTDCDLQRASYVENGDGYILTAGAMAWFWDHYLPNPAERSDPRASPIRATDLAGLPTALIQTAEFDPLRDEGEAYAAALQRAGVAVTMQRRAGLIHGYLGMCAAVPAAALAMDDVVAWIAQTVRSPSV